MIMKQSRKLSHSKPWSQNGFTLIELLVVIAIIGVLSGIVISSVGEARIRARDVARVAFVRELQNALELYHNDFGNYPTLVSWYNLNRCPAQGAYPCLGEILQSYIKIPDSSVSPFNCASPSDCGWYNRISNGRGYMIAVPLERTGLLNSGSASSACYTPTSRFCACVNCPP